MRMKADIDIEDTYSEAFDGLFSRLCITAIDDKRLEKASVASTSLPCTVFRESEGGIEKIIPCSETPDNRKGAIIQIWVNYKRDSLEKLEYELGKRIRQGILVVPTTSVFNYLDSDDSIDIMEKVGNCGDGYERTGERYGREMINIPIMMGEFLIERHLGYGRGIMGGTIWFFCRDIKSALEVGDRAVDAIREMEDVITSFDICSAGSKMGSRYPHIGPSTNHPYCPTLQDKIADSKVPKGVKSIPEIVINGVNLKAVKKAMKTAIESAADVKGLVGISAGNYGGKLGKHKIYLRDIAP